MNSSDESVLNTDTIRDHLDERVREGLSPAESAGEEMFMKNKMVDMGLMAKATRREADEIVDRWLEEQVGANGFRTARFLAEQYARFMSEKLPKFDLSSHAIEQLHSARRAWRTQTSG